ncbi:hypothetical protein [Nocardioides mangrovi]|uniref:Lipoprotein n=1 Tax=Nocardioides mangrovi TaxID=2874580 RepID=A0ABS7UGR8_9ACTN|nr:hypothetical protein [Nocardioides mangrovi]MBZ5739967.1 hypothetical protein [Nocardioides mangrovi]
MTIRLVAGTAAAVLLLSVAACGSDDSDDSGTASPAPATPTASATPELITYQHGGDPGVQVETLGEKARLKGAPDDFADFIGQTAQVLAEQSTCSDGYVGVTVAVVRSDGFARGGVNDCGGYAALWARTDSAWAEIDGTQEMWDCSTLEEYAVPSDVAGSDCWDSAANKRRDYQHA